MMEDVMLQTVEKIRASNKSNERVMLETKLPNFTNEERTCNFTRHFKIRKNAPISRANSGIAGLKIEYAALEGKS